MGAPVGDKYYLCNTPIMFVYFTLIKYQAALNVSKSSEAVLACDWRVYFRAQTEGGYFPQYSVNDLSYIFFKFYIFLLLKSAYLFILSISDEMFTSMNVRKQMWRPGCVESIPGLFWVVVFIFLFYRFSVRLPLITLYLYKMEDNRNKNKSKNVNLLIQTCNRV